MKTIKQLSTSELAAFRSWFIESNAAQWDRQIGVASETGKLNRLAQSGCSGKAKAIKSKTQTAALQGQKDFENAAKACVEAAFLYKKILFSPPAPKTK